MKTIQVPTRDQVSEASQVLFDQLQKRSGKVPNLYATVGYSATALQAFLQFDEQFNHGVFAAKEREAIALVVSQVNGCNYCLAAHTLAAKVRGFNLDDTLAIRRAEVTDGKLNAILQLAKSIAENQGHAESELVENFFAAGYDEGALMELVGLVTVRIFTNYVYALTNIPVDFPAAPVLATAEL
ncbi:carboxymuconolactone decarboxylase family protein [Spirosoma soli]|uniref:Carboxymuconolactone decarboxylase family protein n=1 Tax=Spirosoma soli TaxID=1770529 RepID=A0ABW5MC55_9BACT